MNRESRGERETLFSQNRRRGFVHMCGVASFVPGVLRAIAISGLLYVNVGEAVRDPILKTCPNVYCGLIRLIVL